MIGWLLCETSMYVLLFKISVVHRASLLEKECERCFILWREGQGLGWKRTERKILNLNIANFLQCKGTC